MTDDRPSAVAGRFYPADPTQLRTAIRRMLERVKVSPNGDPLAPAYVVPHAGYRFSGPVAAQVYARLRPHKGSVSRVVLIGPSHFARLEGVAASPAATWSTPLGTVKVTAPPKGVPVDAEPHVKEHSLEVQIPFLQEVLGDVTVTPIAVGVSAAEDIADTLDDVIGGPDAGAIVLCSTDFSHYHPQDVARELDRRTAQAVCDLDYSRIKVGDACGVFALRGMVAWAARRRLRPRRLDLRNSGDTFGNPERVVGYPAFAMEK